MKTPNPDHPIRNTLKHLALAFALGAGLGAGSAQAQTIIEVGGAGTIGVTPMTTAKVPATGVNWTAAGGQSGAGGGGIYSGLVSTTATTIAATGNVTLTFDHTYHFESGWDGGAVFVSINGGAFTYLPGSSFTTGGYDGITVSSAWPAGTEGRPAVFYSDTPKTVQSVADLGSWPAGTKIAVEFRGGWDEGLVRGPVAWEISTVKLTDAGPNDILKLNFTVDGPSGFTVSNIGTVAGPWKYLKPISKFEINADDLTADQYSLPVEVGTVIDLNNAKLSVVLLSGTLDPGDTFALFDLASGTTLTGAIDSISLPIGRWNTTNLAVNGTITYLGPLLPECPLGVWKPSANGGINPATGVAWAVGDTYRLAFVTSGTTTFVSNDIATYNSFVQGLAAASTKFPKLGNGTWKVLGSTEAVNAKVNTGTNTGTGVPVLLMDGTTVFATNNADLWNGTNLRPDAGSYYSIYRNENGVDVGSAQVGTGTNSSGGTVAAQWFGNSNGSTIVNLGLTTPNRYDRWMMQYHASNETPLRVYALSAPLTLQAMVVANLPTTTLVINLGAGTVIEGGAFGTFGAGNLPIPALPVGSILRSVSVNTAITATDNENFASDLAILFDPTPATPGGDFSLRMTSGAITFGAANQLTWPTAAEAGPPTALVDTKDASAWSAVGPIDLATYGIFLGNAFQHGGWVAGQGATWSGTITLTYDLVSTGSPYDTWAANNAPTGNPDDDYDGDGVSNAAEFVLGGSKDTNDLEKLPKPGTSGTDMTFTFVRDQASIDAAVKVSIEVSPDLTDWSTSYAVPDADTGGIVNPGVTVVSGTGTDTVTLTVPRDSATKFARLKVVLTQ